MTLNKYYKEREYAESMLSSKKIGTNLRGDLKILAKYYKSQGILPKERETNLYEYCQSRSTEKNNWFNRVLHYGMIDTAVNHSRKKENVLVQIDSVGVTNNEIKYISELELDNLEKKIIFSFIVFDKLKKVKSDISGTTTDQNKDKHYFGGGGDFNYKLLMDSLHEKLTRTYKDKGIHTTIKKFNDMGLTRTTQKLALELLFMDDINESDVIELEIVDFERIGLYYDSYFELANVKPCEKCSIPIRINGNKVKYCDDCFKEKRKNDVRLNVSNYRNKNVIK